MTRSWSVLAAFVAVAASGCRKSQDASGASDPGSGAPAAPVDPCSKAEPHGGGSFLWIVDDYPSALACAKQKKLPILMDLWAPWCHTCLSMQSTVLADKAFAGDAGKFVFVALDTDRENNADAVAKFAPAAWPTFYVIAPDESVLARFVGAASVEQFRTFLDTGLRVLAAGGAGATTDANADAHLLAAERALAQKQLAEAETELDAALAKAPPAWPRRADALTSLISTRQKQGNHDACAQLAEDTLAKEPAVLGHAASASDFLASAIECADKLVRTEPARVTKLRQDIVTALRALLDAPDAKLSIDDRSDAMLNLRTTLVALGDVDGGAEVAQKQRAMLDDAAARAKTPLAAMTYNWHRAEVYAFLDKPLDLVPALEKSVKDLPDEYDPPARLGWIYLRAGKYDEAAKWTERALALVYGPRKTRLLTQRAEIAKAAGDPATQKRYLQAIVQHLESLPASQTSPAAIAKAKEAVEAL